jgi:hypothetical protein
MKSVSDVITENIIRITEGQLMSTYSIGDLNTISISK